MGAIIPLMAKPKDTTRVFDELLALYIIEEESPDWEAGRSALFAPELSETQLRAHLGDLAELRRYFERGGLFIPLAQGNLIAYILPVPDPMVDADAHELAKVIRRLEKVGALQETNLFLAKPFRGRLGRTSS
jgi:hypothetical protein